MITGKVKQLWVMQLGFAPVKQLPTMLVVFRSALGRSVLFLPPVPRRVCPVQTVIVVLEFVLVCGSPPVSGSDVSDGLFVCR